ncbi:MAG: hypothetical protein LBQ37_04590 [Elusimicrobiota bacterium]|jgi:hypothetical protein|nr:hypothetical protein [Elusimicrobiota bacterium]
MKKFLLAGLVLMLLFISAISAQAAPPAKPKAKSAPAAPAPDPRFKDARAFIASSLDAKRVYGASFKPKAKSAPAAPASDPRFKDARAFIASSLDAKRAYAASLEYEKTEEFREAISELKNFDDEVNYTNEEGPILFMFTYKAEFKGVVKSLFVKIEERSKPWMEGEWEDEWNRIGDVEYVDPKKYK